MRFSLLLASVFSIPQSNQPLDDILVFWDNNCRPLLVQNNSTNEVSIEQPKHEPVPVYLKSFGQVVKPQSLQFKWNRIESVFWYSPSPQASLEFYTGDTKYATASITSIADDDESAVAVCGGFKFGGPGVEIKIQDSMLKKLKGKLFETRHSYIKIVKQ